MTHFLYHTCIDVSKFLLYLFPFVSLGFDKNAARLTLELSVNRDVFATSCCVNRKGWTRTWNSEKYVALTVNTKSNLNTAMTAVVCEQNGMCVIEVVVSESNAWTTVISLHSMLYRTQFLKLQSLSSPPFTYSGVFVRTLKQKMCANTKAENDDLNRSLKLARFIEFHCSKGMEKIPFL